MSRTEYLTILDSFLNGGPVPLSRHCCIVRTDAPIISAASLSLIKVTIHASIAYIDDGGRLRQKGVDEEGREIAHFATPIYVYFFKEFGRLSGGNRARKFFFFPGDQSSF